MINKRQKYKYACIKPEDMFTDKLYSFSFNPEEQPLFERFYKSRLNNLTDWSLKMEEVFDLQYSEIDVVIEISQKGRLHYHGYILINDIVKFYLHDLAKLRHYGTYEIDHISDDEKWETYVYKQKRFMEGWCTRNDVKYNIASR